MSQLNAPLALVSPPIGYDDWRRALDRICQTYLSISLDDIPNLSTRDAYNAGTGPAVYFEETVVPTLREEHGSFIDELLSEANDHEDLLGYLAPGEA